MSKRAIWPPVPAGSREWYSIQPIDPHNGAPLLTYPRTRGGWPLQAVNSEFYRRCVGSDVRTLVTDMRSLERWTDKAVKIFFRIFS